MIQIEISFQVNCREAASVQSSEPVRNWCQSV